MWWAYCEFTLDAENFPSKLGGGNVGEDVANVAGNIGAVDDSQCGIARTTEGDLALVELPAPAPTVISRATWTSRCGSGTYGVMQ